MIYAWGFISSILVITCETMFKLSDSYWPRLWLFAPLAIAVNYSIFRLVQSAPNLPAAFAVFAAVNIVMRVAVSLSLGHPIAFGTWIAVVLLLLAAAARQVWQ